MIFLPGEVVVFFVVISSSFSSSVLSSTGTDYTMYSSQKIHLKNGEGVRGSCHLIQNVTVRVEGKALSSYRIVSL